MNSKRSKAKRKERVQNDAQCSANRGGEREKGKKKERKNKEIGNSLPHTRYALSTPPPGIFYIIYMEQYK
jgi:hypothetical protein